MGHHGVINLVGRNGILYVRVSGESVIYGEPVNTAGLAAMIKRSETSPTGSGYVNASSTIDLVAKYFSFRALSHYPLIISAGVAEDEILRIFWSETWGLVTSTGLFSIALILATVVAQTRMNTILVQSNSLRLQAQMLEMRNQELADQSLALSKATQEAQVADRLKGEFIANMSHELRTPLNAIIGFSSLLLDSATIGAKKHSRSYIERISIAGNHLLDLVTGVLEIAKLESGSLEVSLGNFDLNLIVGECIEITEVLRENKSIELTLDISQKCMVRCDLVRVRQITLNILSNAIKFSSEGSRLNVKISGGGYLPGEVMIADSGIGMTEDEIEIALTPFGQVSSGMDKNHSGTGLGLPLAKRLVEIQGGTFAISSAKGSGTTVWFYLPGTTS